MTPTHTRRPETLSRRLAVSTGLLILMAATPSVQAQTKPQPKPIAAVQKGGAPSQAPVMTGEQVVAFSLSPTAKPTAPANSVPRAFGHPDFSGLWLQDQGILWTDMTPKHHGGSHPGYDDNINFPPFTPEYAARYAAFKAKVKANGYNRIHDCDPSGMPRVMANPFPMELVQRPEKLLMLFEYKSQMRRAYMDGRGHPSEDDFDSAFMGHSTAKWEGETLVIDTTRIKEDVGKLIQITGIEHSDQLQIIEKVRFLNRDWIEWEITMIDPKAFTKPWVNRRSFSRKSLSVDVPEYACTVSELIGELGYVKKTNP